MQQSINNSHRPHCHLNTHQTATFGVDVSPAAIHHDNILMRTFVQDALRVQTKNYGVPGQNSVQIALFLPSLLDYESLQVGRP